VIGLWREPAGLIAGAVVLAVGVALFTPALFALALKGIPANERGAVMGTTSAFLDLAFGLGPATLGFVAAAAGRGGTFLAGSAVAAAGLVLVAATRLGRPATPAREARPS
jgi:MFS family permease